MKSATLPHNIMSSQHGQQYHTSSYSSTSSTPNHQNGRAIANRLDDAIAQLRNLKQNGPRPFPVHSMSASSPDSPVYHESSPISSSLHGSNQQTTSRLYDYHSQSQGQGQPQGQDTYIATYHDTYPDSTGQNDETVIHKTVTVTSSGKSVKSPPPTAKKPSIPPQLRRPQNTLTSPANRSSPSTSSSSVGSIGDSNSATVNTSSSTVTFDSMGRCTCCPFGYHVDVDFVNFSMEQSPTHTFNRPLRKPRLSTDSRTPSPRSTSSAPNYSNLFIDDMDHRPIKPVRVDTSHSPASQRTYYRSQSASEYKSPSVSSVKSAPPEEPYRGKPNGQLVRSDSNETLDSMMNYTNAVKTTRRTVTSTELAETMATHLPDNGGTEALTISPESVEQIKKHMALSLQRMEELEEQIKVIPMMQERISRLKLDKRQLAEQLSRKSGLSAMRSVGVGDYDVDEEETRVEKVIQRVVQEAPPKPSRDVGVGNYDVSIEYVTEAEAYHTIAERVQRIKEKEIQSWVQEGERQLQERRAAMRSIGIGDGDVFAEPEPIKVKEKEVKTVYLEPEKPEQRNVGLQAKPVMRDVCIEFSQHEDKPLTRTCGINVDLNDILQETQQSEEVERTEYGEVQQAGALATGQKNAWQTQKHVIQRKFMEAMTRGTQKDLVAFITGLLRRSVRSVGTNVKPTTAEFGMLTVSNIKGNDIGVGDDSVNVIVKPWTMTRDNFCTVKPVMRTQPTWTDLILTCDSATNTQVHLTERAVNTKPIEPVPVKQENITTTLNVQPAHQYTIEKEMIDVKDSTTNTKRPAFFTNAQTSPKPVKPVFKTELSTFGFNIEEEELAMLHILLEPAYKTELETYGHQKYKLYEPLYKTEIATSCRPVVECLHTNPTVRPEVVSKVNTSSQITRTEKTHYVGSTRHVSHVTQTNTSKCINERSYPTIIANLSTYKQPVKEPTVELDQMLESRLEELLKRCLIDDRTINSTNTYLYSHYMSLTELSDSAQLAKPHSASCQLTDIPQLDTIFVISPFSSASDITWSSSFATDEDSDYSYITDSDIDDEPMKLSTSDDRLSGDCNHNPKVFEHNSFQSREDEVASNHYPNKDKEMYTGSMEQMVSPKRQSPSENRSSRNKRNQSTANTENLITTTATTKTVTSGQADNTRTSDSQKTSSISREYVNGLLGIGGNSSSHVTSQEVVLSSPNVKPESLVEQTTEISTDGTVSEVVREVKSAPGIHAERTVKVTKKEGPHGTFSESVESQSSSQESASKTTRVSLDNDSLLGANFHKHKEEMMKLLGGQKEALSPISVDVAPHHSGGGSSSSSSTTTTTTKKISNLSPSVHSPASSMSPGGVIIEREGQAQRRYEEELRRKGQFSPSTSVSRHVTNTTGDQGDFKEVIEEKESADGSTKEVLIERSFTSSSSSGGGRYPGRIPDFSDYFGRNTKMQPPRGRADRMKSYDQSTYSSTSSAEIERNKTEIAGDPLKARYNIDDLASPGSRNTSRQETTTTTVVTSHGQTHLDDESSLRSIMKKDSKESPSHRNITFAEQATVAEVIEGDEIPVHHELVEESGESDGESEEESFEEGTYEARQGDVSYQCDADRLSSEQSNLTKAKSQEEIDIDVELQAACSIVQQHIERGEENADVKVNSALSVIQQDWFKVASGQNASVREVDGYMACFEDFSTDLLEHIVNMADGNGNTVLHYAVSHCNFPVVHLLIESGVSDVNLQNKAGYTPIMLAALAEVQSPDDREAIRLLLSKGNVNLAASQAGQTALMLAVSHGRYEMVELLLEAGADVNLQDEDGSTALMCATEHGHITIVKTLLNHPDIDISLKDNDGSTALEIALENSQKEIGMLLYAKDQAIKANSTTSIKKRASRIPSSGKSSKSTTRTTVVTQRRH